MTLPYGWENFIPPSVSKLTAPPCLRTGGLSLSKSPELRIVGDGVLDVPAVESCDLNKLPANS